MPSQKRTVSKVIQRAAARAAGMNTIDAALDLGGGVTLPSFRAKIASALAQQAAYNEHLAQADDARTLHDVAEKEVRDYSERMLAAVAGRFGRDSNEYQKAGGRRKSDRRRSVALTRAPELIALPKAA